MGSLSDAFPRCGELECVLLHGAHELVDGAAERVHQLCRRRDDEQDAAADDDRRGEALLAADLAGQPSVQRIERESVRREAATRLDAPGVVGPDVTHADREL